MSSKAEKDRQKQIQDRCQALLTQMLRDDDNKYCVDCDAKGPRWASWNLGIFLCIRCAGIHRNLGVHISKVKSVNLDSWTPEQVVCLEQMGNSRARAVYEANLPDSFRRPQTDSALESFIRAKYEHKKYIAREWCPPPMPKVNWDKELEEEEKLKKKKRESKNNATVISSTVVKKLENVIPAPLPKPASSPKTSRTSGSSVSAQASPAPAQPASADLLGLDTPCNTSGSDELFGNMVSAEPLKNSTRSQEEENFFNQPAQPPPANKKLSTDSILALYNSTPTHFPHGNMFGSQPFNQFQSVQNGMNPLSQSNMMQNKMNPVQQPAPINSSMPQMFNSSMPGQQFPQSNLMMQKNMLGQTGSIPVMGSIPVVPNMNSLSTNMQHSTQQIPFGPFCGSGTAVSSVSGASGVATSNPFYRMAAPQAMPPVQPLQQQSTNSFVSQLSGLTLDSDGVSSIQSQSTLSNNLWQ